MPAKDLGTKHTCWKCGTKFYDLKKARPACPKCGSDPKAAPVVKPAPSSERRRPHREEPVGDVEDTLEDAELDEELAAEDDPDDDDD